MVTELSTRLGEFVGKIRALDPAWRWAIGVYAAARVFYSIWGAVIVFFVPSLLQNLVLFDEPLVASFDLSTSDRQVYSRCVGERVLTFRDNGEGTMTDNETGSVWSVREGIALRGALAGTKLEQGKFTADDLFPYHGVTAERGWFGVWQRFDVLWYQAIAEKGYGATPGDIHFPPLYPLLERVLGGILGGRVFIAGWLISQAALVWSIALLYRLAQKWRDEATAGRAVVLTVLFPTAFFFFTAYSESLFLLFSLLAFRALEREQWTWVGFFVLLAILTRLQGVALIVPLMYCVWGKYSSEKKISAAQWIMVGLPLLAGIFYLALRATVGESSILPTSEPQLNAHLAPPWENIIYAVETIASGRFLTADVLNLAVAVVAVFVLARGWRLLPITMGLYCGATLVLVMIRYVDTQPLNSMTRYVLTLFPLFMVLGQWSKNRWVERVIVYLSIPLALYLSAQFFLWGWVA